MASMCIRCIAKAIIMVFSTKCWFDAGICQRKGSRVECVSQVHRVSGLSSATPEASSGGGNFQFPTQESHRKQSMLFLCGLCSSSYRDHIRAPKLLRTDAKDYRSTSDLSSRHVVLAVRVDPNPLSTDLFQRKHLLPYFHSSSKTPSRT